MISIQKVMLLIAALSIGNAAVAQKLGDTISNEQMARMAQEAARRNDMFAGRALAEFSAMTSTGKSFNNASLHGKITLLVFWYPSCGCFNFKKLDTLSKTFRDTDFQIIAIGADTSDLGLYKQLHFMPYTYVFVRNYAQLRELSLHNGQPTLMLLNRAAVIVSLKGFTIGPFDTKYYLDMIRGLLQ